MRGGYPLPPAWLRWKLSIRSTRGAGLATVRVTDRWRVLRTKIFVGDDKAVSAS